MPNKDLDEDERDSMSSSENNYQLEDEFMLTKSDDPSKFNSNALST